MNIWEVRKTNLFPHQIEGLKQTEGKERCALYWDMGLGKTFGGSEKMIQYGNKVNLIICQKSKVSDWVEHFTTYYPDYKILDLTCKNSFQCFMEWLPYDNLIGVINYELAFRRPELKKLKDFTLMLDESSMIQNEQAKRSRFILKLQPKNVILLSGTPTGGKYEKLWSQCHLLGWPISKTLYWKQYIDTEIKEFNGFPVKIVKGYKNVERLKSKLRQYGAVFMKSEEVFDLPKQIDTIINIPTSKEYRKFRKDSIVKFKDVQLVGDTTLTKMLYERQLCGQYSEDKVKAFVDLLESTDDRLIVFYNFTEELNVLRTQCEQLQRKVSIVNGTHKNLDNYEHVNDSVTFIQYQAGAMGLNLQKANKIIYFTLPLSSELFEQSKKRIHRIGQEKTCFYYYLICKGSVEQKIYETLKLRKDYTEKLFEKERT